MKPSRLAGLAVCALLAPALVFPGLFLGISLPSSGEASGLNDLYDVNIPLRVFAGRAIAEGRLPLWYPGSNAGMALASLPEAVPFYPFSTAFYALLDPVRATAWSILFHLWLAGLGAGLLAGRLGSGYPGQLLAAVCAGAGLWLPEHMRQMNLLQSAAWVPWAWLFFDRFLISPRAKHAAGLAFCMGMLALAGHLQMAHHTAVVFIVWSLLRILPRRRLRSRRAVAVRLAWLLGAALIAFMIAAPHILPQLEIARLADRSQMASPPAFPSMLAMLHDPLRFGDPTAGIADPDLFFERIAWEHGMYLGLAPLLFAVVASASRPCLRRKRTALALLMLACGILAFGWQCPGLGRALKWIPFASMLRFPHRYLWFANIALAVLAAQGLTLALLRIDGLRRARPSIVRALAIAVPIATALDLAYFVPRLCPVGSPDPWMQPPATLALLEKAGGAPGGFAERIATWQFTVTARKAFLDRNGWRTDTLAERELRWFLAAQQPSIWGWQTLRGHVGLIPSWIAYALTDQHLRGIMETLEYPTYLRPQPPLDDWLKLTGMYGARWIASPAPVQSPSLAALGDIPGEHFHCYLYENKEWTGPAWIARKAVAESAALFLSEPADPDRAATTNPALGYGMPDANRAADRRAEIKSFKTPRPEIFDIRCELLDAGILVLNSSYHPRWRVLIDGRPGPAPSRVNLLQMAVRLSAGSHRVEFQFAGNLERRGLIACAVALIVCGALSVPLRRRQPAGLR